MLDRFVYTYSTGMRGRRKQHTQKVSSRQQRGSLTKKNESVCKGVLIISQKIHKPARVLDTFCESSVPRMGQIPFCTGRVRANDVDENYQRELWPRTVLRRFSD